MSALTEQGERARVAARRLNTATSAEKDAALRAAADALVARTDEIVEANAGDLEQGRSENISEALLDRLSLDPARIGAIADGLRQVAALKDPVGEVLDGWTLANGIEIKKVRVPLGVIGIIYEARPNVTVDAAGLCLKSGNAVILRGSSVAHRSNTKLAEVLRDALEESGLPADCVQLVADTSRETATELMGMRGYIDVLIPRGGAGLISSVVENAKVPVIETGVGNCHVYVDAAADIDKALDIVVNAKTNRPSVCNAAESLLIHSAIAPDFLPRVGKLLADAGVELRADPASRKILAGAGIAVTPASDSDWGEEFLDLIMAVAIVDSLDNAIAHVNEWGSNHTEAILTEDLSSARRFCAEVDAAATVVNASTRFTDGGEFGFGAEIGISTQKLHARGPMALPELTSYKYMLWGDGQVRK
ncbi:MAG: glutamate-5-semialdehyde dehydrogenase [Acidobacteria bacterium]|nr:MAG: glutamate-5-semialdehyde dehydrogenase [Acidobacteriota bacterium]